MYIVITSVREKNHLQKITDQKDLFLDKWLLFYLNFSKMYPHFISKWIKTFPLYFNIYFEFQPHPFPHMEIVPFNG